MSLPMSARSEQLRDPLPTPEPGHRPGALGRLAGVAFRHRALTLVAWLVAFGVAFGLSTALAGDFTADYSAPGADSTRAQQLLEERFPAASGAQIDVVVRADAAVTDPATRQEVTGLLRGFAAGPDVAGVGDPYTTPGAISADGRVLLTRITLDHPRAADVPPASVKALLDQAAEASGPGLAVSLGGEAVGLTEQGAIGSEVIGLAAAAVILLLTFGSVVAAGLPIGTALAGLAVSSMLTGLIAAVMPVPDWSTSLATMIGIGVGIDYALLLVTRFREFRVAGLDSQRATVAALDTAGRAVLLAGGTVVVSMLGLFGMGLAYMRGAALVTIIAVLVVMLSAFTLFPALLGLLGNHLDRLRIPLPRRRRDAAPAGSTPAASGRWVAWSRLVQQRRVAATVLGTALLLLIAAPFLSVRFGFPDAGNDAAGSSTRATYTAVADAFGPGANGPLLVVADLTSTGGDGPAAASALARVEAGVRATPGVAATSGVVTSPAGDAAIITVTPTTGPQDAATEDLVTTLRDRVAPGRHGRQRPGRPCRGRHRRGHRQHGERREAAARATRRRRRPVDAAAVRRLPQRRRPAQGRRHEPALGGRRLRRGRARPAGRVGRAAVRHRGRRRRCRPSSPC